MAKRKPKLRPKLRPKGSELNPISRIRQEPLFRQRIAEKKNKKTVEPFNPHDEINPDD